MELQNYERDTLQNLLDCFLGLDWEEESDSLERFFGCVPEIGINLHGATLDLWANNKEMIIGFGEYGGAGEIWNGDICWQTTDHDREDASLDFFDNYVRNGSPLYVWREILQQLDQKL